MAKHLSQGQAAESKALDFLQHKGLRLLSRNYRCKNGEIDLIMQQGETLVFVEVRFRQSSRFGSAAESVTSAKQHKLLLTANHYLQQNGMDSPCRFDVLGIGGKDQTEIEWIQNAFQAD